MLEADFQRYYGIDLDAEFDSLGCRRMFVLFDGLPGDAAVWRQGDIGEQQPTSTNRVTDLSDPRLAAFFGGPVH